MHTDTYTHTERKREQEGLTGRIVTAITNFMNSHCILYVYCTMIACVKSEYFVCSLLHNYDDAIATMTVQIEPYSRELIYH